MPALLAAALFYGIRGSGDGPRACDALEPLLWFLAMRMPTWGASRSGPYRASHGRIQSQLPWATGNIVSRLALVRSGHISRLIGELLQNADIGENWLPVTIKF